MTGRESCFIGRPARARACARERARHDPRCKGCCPLGWQRRIAALGLRSMPSGRRHRRGGVVPGKRHPFVRCTLLNSASHPLVISSASFSLSRARAIPFSPASNRYPGRWYRRFFPSDFPPLSTRSIASNRDEAAEVPRQPQLFNARVLDAFRDFSTSRGGSGARAVIGISFFAVFSGRVPRYARVPLFPVDTSWGPVDAATP